MKGKKAQAGETQKGKQDMKNAFKKRPLHRISD